MLQKIFFYILVKVYGEIILKKRDFARDLRVILTLVKFDFKK